MVNERQRRIVDYVRSNPGCTKMAVCRHEWSGRGHYASYAAVDRLIRRGLIEDRKNGHRCALFAKGSAPSAVLLDCD